MEPKQNGLPGSMERGAAQPASYEGAAYNPDYSVIRTQENKIESRPEVGAVRAEASQVAMPALPAPVVVQSDQSVTQGAASDDGIPSVAGDDDLIEKEWVDKAKKILAETKDDPYRREREISKLQIEYIKKRYGRVIGDAVE